MKKLLPSLSKTCAATAVVCFVLFLVLPIKIVLLTAFIYATLLISGLFKSKFPDVWEVREEKGMVDKVHKTFLAKPVCVDGTWYLFRYVNRVVDKGVTTYHLKKSEVEGS